MNLSGIFELLTAKKDAIIGIALALLITSAIAWHYKEIERVRTETRADRDSLHAMELRDAPRNIVSTSIHTATPQPNVTGSTQASRAVPSTSPVNITEELKKDSTINYWKARWQTAVLEYNAVNQYFSVDIPHPKLGQIHLGFDVPTEKFDWNIPQDSLYSDSTRTTITGYIPVTESRPWYQETPWSYLLGAAAVIVALFTGIKLSEAFKK